MKSKSPENSCNPPNNQKFSISFLHRMLAWLASIMPHIRYEDDYAVYITFRIGKVIPVVVPPIVVPAIAIAPPRASVINGRLVVAEGSFLLSDITLIMIEDDRVIINFIDINSWKETNVSIKELTVLLIPYGFFGPKHNSVVNVCRITHIDKGRGGYAHFPNNKKAKITNGLISELRCLYKQHQSML